METINRKQFSRRFAETYNTTYQVAEQFCKDVFELVGVILFEEGNNLTIQGFGSFKQKVAKAHNIRHPGTGEITNVSEKRFVKFNPSDTIEIKTIE